MLNIVEENKLSDDDKKEIDQVFGTDDSKPISLESKYLIKIRSRVVHSQFSSSLHWQAHIGSLVT
jgi:hypothetical protein